jgi:hypothetical protein
MLLFLGGQLIRRIFRRPSFLRERIFLPSYVSFASPGKLTIHHSNSVQIPGTVFRGKFFIHPRTDLSVCEQAMMFSTRQTFQTSHFLFWQSI